MSYKFDQSNPHPQIYCIAQETMLEWILRERSINVDRRHGTPRWR